MVKLRRDYHDIISTSILVVLIVSVTLIKRQRYKNKKNVKHLIIGDYYYDTD